MIWGTVVHAKELNTELKAMQTIGGFTIISLKPGFNDTGRITSVLITYEGDGF